MSNVLTFYSVGADQVAHLFKDFGVDIKGNETEGAIEGKTPLGDVKMEYSFHAQSGQLTVVVVHKPFLLSMNTIDSQIKGKLAEADGAVPPAETPVSPTVPAAPPATPPPIAQSTNPTPPPAVKAVPVATPEKKE